MAGGIVTIGRRQYASGLYWEISSSGRISQAAKEAARQPSVLAEFYAARAGTKTGRVPQFGLSQGDSGHRAGLPVLAACLANQQPGSWAGAFRLREGTAIVVVRDDLIVPDGDLFFADETEARDRLLQEMALGGLQKVYAPETWGVSGADSMPVALLLNDSTEVKLHSVALSKQTIMVLGGLGAVLLLLLGIGWYIQQENAKVEAARLARAEALNRARAEAERLLPGFVQTAPEYPLPERKWENKPPPLDVMQACRDALSRAPAVVAGWRLESAHCDETSLSEKWTRTSGFSAPPPQSTVNDNGTSASLSITWSPLKPRSPEALRDPEEITRRYLAQNWPGSLARMQDDPPPPPPPDFKGAWNPPPPPWIKRSFTLSMPVLPWTLPVFFADLPGVVVNALSLSSSGMNSTWTIDGVIYENRH
ncbi:MAG: type 4b pilus protein PilO2 [Alphaproteobacteria bacterium]|nr:type 4b pilus protein PilO2 [Alphaproteobacteria bacterium]